MARSSKVVMVVPKRVFTHFGTIFEYPTPDLGTHVAECEDAIGDRFPKAIADLQAFRQSIDECSMGYLEEIHTAYFDLNPVARPYVGYHLFGESYRRSIFMIRLKEIYAEKGFSLPEVELPDRLSVFLKFLGTNDDQALARELIDDALGPTMARMTGMEVPVSRLAAGRGRARSAKKEKEQAGPVPGGAASNTGQTGGGSSSTQLEGDTQGGGVDDGVLLEGVQESAGVSSSQTNLYEKPLRSLARVVAALWEPVQKQQAAAGRDDS